MLPESPGAGNPCCGPVWNALKVPLPFFAIAAQLMPAWNASDSVTSTIFASMITCWVAICWILARYSCTSRSSRGVARTATNA